MLTAHFNLLPKLRECGVILLFPLYVFMAWAQTNSFFFILGILRFITRWQEWLFQCKSVVIPLRSLEKHFNSSTVYWLLVTLNFSITPIGKSISYLFTQSFSHSYTPWHSKIRLCDKQLTLTMANTNSWKHTIKMQFTYPDNIWHLKKYLLRTKNEMAGWRVHGPEKDEYKWMER